MKQGLVIAAAVAGVAGLAGLAGLAGTACSGAPLLPELERAEERERAGDGQAALRAYRAAQSTCRGIDDPLRRRASCADAYLGPAELLVDLGREREAAAAFERAATALADDAAARARATLRAGQLHLDLGNDRRAYEHLWRVVTETPEQAFAADALVLLLRDGRRRDASQLFQVLVELYERLSATEIGDNLVFTLAQLAEEERRDLRLALSFHDTLARRYPKSGLRDDALWHGARLARQLGNAAGAERRLRALLATREVAWGAGSYFSVWLDDAQLELGRVLRDELRRPGAALDEFARLPRDYPASILRDDALWERALTFQQMGRARHACESLVELRRRHPDSRWEVAEAPARRRALGCPGT